MVSLREVGQGPAGTSENFTSAPVAPGLCAQTNAYCTNAAAIVEESCQVFLTDHAPWHNQMGSGTFLRNLNKKQFLKMIIYYQTSIRVHPPAETFSATRWSHYPSKLLTSEGPNCNDVYRDVLKLNQFPFLKCFAGYIRSIFNIIMLRL